MGVKMLEALPTLSPAAPRLLPSSSILRILLLQGLCLGPSSLSSVTSQFPLTLQVSVLMSPPQGSHLRPLDQDKGPFFTI